jgi:acyl carrier protein
VSDLEQRVLECFGAVFPGIPPERLPELSRDEVADWDSIAHVTIIAALGETFATEFDFEAFFEARSFLDVTEVVRTSLATKDA